MSLEDLTDDQKARAKECKTPEGLMTLAKEEGIEITDAQLEAASGGSWNSNCDDHKPRRKRGFSDHRTMICHDCTV